MLHDLDGECKILVDSSRIESLVSEVERLSELSDSDSVSEEVVSSDCLVSVASMVAFFSVPSSIERKFYQTCL